VTGKNLLANGSDVRFGNRPGIVTGENPLVNGSDVRHGNRPEIVTGENLWANENVVRFGNHPGIVTEENLGVTGNVVHPIRVTVSQPNANHSATKHRRAEANRTVIVVPNQIGQIRKGENLKDTAHTGNPPTGGTPVEMS
jgi:hypothetical protein